MRKLISYFLIGGIFCLISSTSLLFSQPITVRAIDAPSKVETFFEMSAADSIPVNLGQAGADQTWDFSTISLTYKSYWEVIDFSQAPFIKRFPESNLVYKVTYDNNDTITYNFVKITDSDLTELGLGKLVISGADTIVTELVIGKRATPRLKLPATYGDPNWSSVLALDTTLFSFKVTVIDSSYNQVDGWGKIKTHFGEFPCLRIRQDHSRFANTLFGKVPLEININYFWVTNTYGIIATVTGLSDISNPNPNPNYTQAKSIDIMTDFRFPTSVDGAAGANIPIDFELFQNYPNPFNPGTTISYQVNDISEVTLKVFNLAGQEVATLVRSHQRPGHYEVEWNASDFPSGVYYFQIQANGNVVTKKGVLLK
jgi:hypothetical protein